MSKGKIIAIVAVIVVIGVGGIFLLGSSGEETNTSKELSLQNVTFCSEQPGGYQDYQKQPNSTYSMPREGQKTFWMYADVSGVSYEEVEQGKKVDVDAYLTVESPDGTLIFDNYQIVDDLQTYSEGTDLSTYYLIPHFTLQDIGQLETPYGDYTVEIEVVDSQAEETDTATTSFTIQEE